MGPTKERNLTVSGTDEASRYKEDVPWGPCPQTPGIFRFDANPNDDLCS